MLLVLCLLALVMLLPYLVGPAIVRRTFRHRAEPRLVPVEWMDMPVDARAFLEGTEADLLQEGFERAGRVRDETVPTATAWVSVMVHRGHRDLAQIAAVARADGKTAYAVEERQVEFLTEWPGHEMLTSNSAQVLPFGAIRGQALVRIVGLQDARLLHRIHRARVCALGVAHLAFLPPAGAEVDAVAASGQRFIEAQAARGNVRLSPGEDAYVLTWRGAIGATWKHLWPFRGLELARARKQAARLLEQLDLELPSDPAATVRSA